MKTVFLLLIIYQIKHFLADYPLQGRYMLGKFAKYPVYIKPLAAHVAVHGVMTFFIAALFGSEWAPLLALIDMTLHFVMDRIKASPDLLGRFKPLSAKEMYQILGEDAEYIKRFLKRFPGTQTSLNLRDQNAARVRSNTFFWWSLGLDQMVHHLTHYLLIYLILVTQ